LTLTKFAKKVYLIHRRDSFRASKVMQDRVLKNEKIEIICDATVEEIIGEKKVEGIRLKSIVPLLHGSIDKQKTMKQFNNETIALDGVFVAIGHKPDTDLFKGQIELDEKGYIITKRRATSVKGIFAAGDCADPYYRQAIIAAGDGVEAALEVERYLELI